MGSVDPETVSSDRFRLDADTPNRTAHPRRVGRLVSLNVGGPREVPWEGKTVRTAIWKDPVLGPRLVRRINIDGDDQADRAGHGGEHRAVYVYQLGSYRYWEGELGWTGLECGHFGENFTVDGLADDEVCIGDRYRIGGAVFEVTQPRVTCFRLGIRTGEPRMPSLLVAHHRPGFYLRVVEEGMVQAGDEIVRVTIGPEQLTVADVDGLLYLPHRSRPMLERALRIPALSEGWKGSFRELLEHGDAAGAAPVPAWQGFQPLTVTAVTRESATITSFTLVPAEGSPVTTRAFSPGQYLTLRLRIDGPHHPPVVRSYSLSRPDGAGGYRISVKREPRGGGSAFLHEHVQVGDVIETAAARGSFTLRDGDRPIVLVSAGVGATPVLAMLNALAAAGSRRTVWWVHGARSHREYAFGAEVSELLSRLPSARRVVSFSRPDAEERPGEEFDAAGRVTIDTFTAAAIPADADYYLCGPETFMRSLSAALIAHGTPPEQVSTETFGALAAVAPGVLGTRPAPHQPSGPPADGPPVTFTRSNLTVAWDPALGNLLEFAEACDVPVAFGCRNGVCHSCETGLVDGAVSYVTEPLDRPDDERVLVCCAQPRGAVTLEL
jgi:ferredoxin-NADP reductase/MOSC domain-containing protein YiiM